MVAVDRIHVVAVKLSGPADWQLRRLIHDMGFSSIQFARPSPWIAERCCKVNRLNIVIAFSDHQPTMEELIWLKILRLHPLEAICLTPAIIVGKMITESTMRRCLNVGFDDIITEPIKTEILRDRILQTITCPLEYYETIDYFGPDRRRCDLPGLGLMDRRGTAISDATRFIIERSEATGCRVVRRELIEASPPADSSRHGFPTAEVMGNNGSLPLGNSA